MRMELMSRSTDSVGMENQTLVFEDDNIDKFIKNMAGEHFGRSVEQASFSELVAAIVCMLDTTFKKDARVWLHKSAVKRRQPTQADYRRLRVYVSERLERLHGPNNLREVLGDDSAEVPAKDRHVEETDSSPLRAPPSPRLPRFTYSAPTVTDINNLLTTVRSEDQILTENKENCLCSADSDERMADVSATSRSATLVCERDVTSSVKRVHSEETFEENNGGDENAHSDAPRCTGDVGTKKHRIETLSGSPNEAGVDTVVSPLKIKRPIKSLSESGGMYALYDVYRSNQGRQRHQVQHPHHPQHPVMMLSPVMGDEAPHTPPLQELTIEDRYTQQTYRSLRHHQCREGLLVPDATRLTQASPNITEVDSDISASSSGLDDEDDDSNPGKPVEIDIESLEKQAYAFDRWRARQEFHIPNSCEKLENS